MSQQKHIPPSPGNRASEVRKLLGGKHYYDKHIAPLAPALRIKRFLADLDIGVRRGTIAASYGVIVDGWMQSLPLFHPHDLISIWLGRCSLSDLVALVDELREHCPTGDMVPDYLLQHLEIIDCGRDHRNGEILCERLKLSDLQKERLICSSGGLYGGLVSFDGYEVYYLTPYTNKKVGSLETAKHMISLSGGLASAQAALRVIEREGRENVALYFADVLWEDEDLYRFLHDFMQMIGGRLYWHTDGRKPLEIAEEHRHIPNSLMAACSYELKIFYFRQFIERMGCCPTVSIGIGPDEPDRIASTAASYANAMPDVQVLFPLCWDPPIPCKDEAKTLQHICVKEWGIELPKLYKLGFHYNNCGGRCVRGGIEACALCWEVLPARAQEKSDWEQKMRRQYPALAGYAFNKRQVNGKVKPITQEEIRNQYRRNKKGRFVREHGKSELVQMRWI